MVCHRAKPSCKGFRPRSGHYNCGVSRHHNRRPERPSNLRTFRTLTPKGETTHYDLCVALLLQIMFAVHAEGVSKRAPPQPSARKAVKPKNPPAAGRSILRTFLSQPFYTTCLRQQAITCGEAALPLNPPASVTILYCYLGPFPVYYTKVTHG